MVDNDRDDLNADHESSYEDDAKNDEKPPPEGDPVPIDDNNVVIKPESECDNKMMNSCIAQKRYKLNQWLNIESQVRYSTKM